MSCIGQNSGVSRKRPLRSEFTTRKLPKRGVPTPRVASSPIVPKEPYVVTKLPDGFWPRPERVMALITRLVLSPYSAGGEPEITSIDWMAFAGIEVEKPLLR